MTSPVQSTPRLIDCRDCPRLVSWRELVAVGKRAAFQDQDYWGRPVPGFGDRRGRLLIVGLAPAAHGANRTGRMFTGDRSGEFLYASLFRTGFANQPQATQLGDGLRLRDCYITAVVRCAPPANRPTRQEIDTCTRWLLPDLGRPGIAVIVALGGVAFERVRRMAPTLGWVVPDQVRFAHGAEISFDPGPRLLASYHPSQQNTFTGRLTPEMLDRIWLRARELLDS